MLNKVTRRGQRCHRWGIHDKTHSVLSKLNDMTKNSNKTTPAQIAKNDVNGRVGERNKARSQYGPPTGEWLT